LRSVIGVMLDKVLCLLKLLILLFSLARVAILAFSSANLASFG
jgi:hypothetical protein